MLKLFSFRRKLFVAWRQDFVQGNFKSLNEPSFVGGNDLLSHKMYDTNHSMSRYPKRTY